MFKFGGNLVCKYQPHVPEQRFRYAYDYMYTMYIIHASFNFVIDSLKKIVGGI